MSASGKFFRHAKIYAKYATNQLNDHVHFLNKYSNLFSIKKNMKMLDVGCGVGNGTNYICEKFNNNVDKMIGTDYSSYMIAYAKHVNTNNKIEYKEMDIATNNLPINFRQNFDKIFSFYCLMWIQDQKVALNNMYNMLNSGGEIFLLFVTNKTQIYDIFFNLYDTNKYNQYASRERNTILPIYGDYRNREQWYKNLLTEVGFKTEVCKIQNHKYRFESLEHMMGFFKSIAPFDVPNDLLEEYTQDIYNEFLKSGAISTKENITIYELKFEIFIIFARKE